MKQKTIKLLLVLCSSLALFSDSYSSIFSFDSFKKITRTAHEEVSLAGIDVDQLRYLLSKVIAEHERVESEQVPEVLVKCYERLHTGNETLYLYELLDMFPLLVDYVAKDMVVIAKAPRLDAPLVTAPNAIVGKDGCDLTPVLALLSIIKKRVVAIPKIICEKIEQLEEILCDKFEQTWTVLADIDQDLFDTRTILCDKFEQTWTILAEILKADCPKVPLTQDDAVGGVILLDQEGINYCMCTNIVGDIIISGTNVMLDMNDRQLTGTIDVCADDVIVRDGKVKPPAPTTVAEAATAAVTVKSPVRNARLLNLLIECADSIGTDEQGNGLNGRAGIDLQEGEAKREPNEKTFVIDCCIKSGAGARGDDGTEVDPTGKNGGVGGIGIDNAGDRAQILRCFIQTGNGGAGGNGFGFAGGGLAGAGGIGINNDGANTCIAQTKIITGAGAQDGSGGLMGAPTGKPSGVGITSSGNDVQITDCTVITGDGAPFAFGSGSGIESSGANAKVSKCLIKTGNGGGGSAGVGVVISGQLSCILDSKITTNNGGDGSAIASGSNGGDGGHGVVLESSAEHTLIARCHIITGSGGNADFGNRDGGKAGHGIFVNGACGTEIRKCVVIKTGSGGNGSGIGSGNDGGDGVFIAAESNDTEVRLCTFSNTGTGGTGSMNGRPGRAVTDLNTDDCSRFACDDGNADPKLAGGASVIFSNFAYAIANLDQRYVINGKDTVEGGVSSNNSVNRLDNVFVDCNVDQMGGCDVRMPISAPTTITEPGSYCLTQDIVGTITIMATNVELDLNNQKIIVSQPDKGVEVDNQSDVLIKNGIIEGGMNGVRVTNAQNVEIIDIDFVANGTGIFIQAISGIQVDNCSFRELQAGDGLCMEDINNGIFTNLNMYNNDFLAGVVIRNSFNLLFERVTVNNNNVLGGFIHLDGALGECIFKECHVNKNSSLDFGFAVLGGDDTHNLQFIDCTVNANENEAGIFGFIAGVSNAKFVNCSANENVAAEDGIFGFLTFGDNVKYINCLANENMSDESFGFAAFGIDQLYDHCCSTSNVGNQTAGVGFLASGTKIIFDSCVANNNFSTDLFESFNIMGGGEKGDPDFQITLTPSGFVVFDGTDCCLLNCIAKQNEGEVPARGISLVNCINSLLKGNVTIDNDDTGIEVVNSGGIGVLTTGVLSNYSSGQTTNYSISPGAVPIATLDFSAGSVTPAGGSGAMSKWHNIETAP